MGASLHGALSHLCLAGTAWSGAPTTQKSHTADCPDHPPSVPPCPAALLLEGPMGSTPNRPPHPSRGPPCRLRAHTPELPELTESGPSLRRPVRSEHCGCSLSTRMISSFWADQMRPSREPAWGWEGPPSEEPAVLSLTVPGWKHTAGHTDRTTVSASDKK